MSISKLQKTSEKRISWDFREVLDLGSVCSIQISDEDEKCPSEVDSKRLVGYIKEHFDLQSVRY